MLVSSPEMLRCIAGRWGSVASAEEKLLGAKGCVATVFCKKLWALSRTLRMILEPLAEDRMRNVCKLKLLTGWPGGGGRVRSWLLKQTTP